MHDRMKLLSIDPSATIRDAMCAIDQATCEIALVVDEESHLLGTITDGDIRRALLAGSNLEVSASKIMNSRFFSIGPNSSRNEVLDLMRARALRQIPVLDSDGRLIGLHLLREIIGSVERPNWVVIMAGGRGTRLKPITDSMPKPMIPIAGRPILERIVLHLVGSGIRRIFIAVNYMAESIEDHFGDGSDYGCQINYLRETTPLGTGGALSLLPSEPEHPIVVQNGDLLTQWDIGRMLNLHEINKTKATIAVHEHEYTVPYGVIETEDGLVKKLIEKPSVSWLANAGVYVLDPSLIARVPSNVNFPLTSLVEECLSLNEPVGIFHIQEDWIDVGQHRELRRATQGVDPS